MVKLKSITRTPNQNKEFLALFILENGKVKKVRFGTKSNYVLNKNKTEIDKKNYILRHKVNESFSNFLSPGSLSRYILWGNSRNINTNIASFKKKFKLL